MKEGFSSWSVTDQLKTKEDIQLYLEACMDEDDGSGSMIRAALSDISRSKNMGELAKQVGVSREGLYKALSESGNPSFSLVLRLSRALGLHIKIAA
jgi:probable addiction module antidote protein